MQNLIDLCNNPYRNLPIVSIEQATLSNGKNCTKIDYYKGDPLLLKVILSLFFTACVLGSAGTALIFKGFRSGFERAVKGEILDPEKKHRIITVYSEKSMQKHLIQRIKSSSSVKKLYKAACEAQRENYRAGINSSDRIFIVFKDALKLETGDPSTANCTPTKGKIRIALGRTEKVLLISAIFELTNLKQQKKHLEIDQKVLSSEITSGTQYAKQVEKIEHNGVKICNKVIKRAVAEDQWPSSMVRYYETASKQTFPEYWRMIKETPHAISYRKKFKWMVKRHVTSHLPFRGQSVS
jgi:hypothetical protein